MALLPPLTSYTETLRWGPTTHTIEPAGYGNSQSFYWVYVSGQGFVHYNHFHPAVDMAAPTGTPILASESGVVSVSGYDSISGNRVRVAIRPGVEYGHGHMAVRSVSVGQKVTRGQKIGTVGSTGAATGPHTHFFLAIKDSYGRTIIWNPKLFLPGGALANDPRILPVNVTHYAVLKGAGINIRTTPDLDVGSTNIYATSRADGIYRAGIKIGALNYKFTYFGDVANDDGTWAKTTGFGRTIYIYKSLVNII